MQGANSTRSKQSEETPVASEWVTEGGSHEGPLLSPLAAKDSAHGTIINETNWEVDLSSNNSMLQDDELSLWMRCPLTDSFDSKYCSDPFGHLAIPNEQLRKDFSSQRCSKESKNLHAGLESSHRYIVPSNLGAMGTAEHAASNRAARTGTAILGAERAADLKLQSDSISEEQATQHDKKDDGDVCTSQESSSSGMYFSEDMGLPEPGTEVGRCVGRQGVWQLSPDSLPWLIGGTGEQTGFSKCFNATISGSAVTDMDKGMAMNCLEGFGAFSSRSSVENNTKGNIASFKKKSSEGVDIGYHSEDAEGIACNVNRLPACRFGTTKRSRAAEVHNQSERRRRDRINDRMKALQQLIPNANKTDKASMLDEAIEYLKMLQSQIQMMSMRTGICFPQLSIPVGMQHARVHHLPALFHRDVKDGFGLGLGMMDATASAACAVISSSPPEQILLGHPSNAMGWQSSSALANTNEPQRCLEIPGLHTAGVKDFSNSPISQQQLQSVQSSMNVHRDKNMYHAFIQQQQLLQQQIQSQPLRANSGSKFMQ